MSDGNVDAALSPRRVATFSGVAAAVVAFGTIFLTTTLAPWFSWPADALSDLGDPGQWGLYWIYNYGLMVTGALGLVFVARTALAARNWAHWAGAGVMAVSMVDLALVGFFHAGRDHHGLVSTVFFVSLTYGVLLYGTGEVLASADRRGLAMLWLGIGHVVQWVVWGALSLGDGVAIPEFLGAVVVVCWMGLYTRKLLGESGGAGVGAPG